jgi:fructose-bisphosphate aldolase class I
MTFSDELATTAEALVSNGKGILAIDESVKTCNKRFEKLGIDPVEEQRRAYRELLLTTPNLGDWISGAILYDETLRQTTADGMPLVEVMHEAGIIPGIKVDTGTVPLPGTDAELITEGLDGLAKRVEEYRAKGALFAKWRAVIAITPTVPSDRALRANAHALARYAKICQGVGLVPIVEPEVLADGNHHLWRSYDATARALHAVFEELDAQGVDLAGIVLKPNMVTAGADAPSQPSIDEVAAATVELLARMVPVTVAGIAFLSGGQDAVLATRHLHAMNALPARKHPWPLTFSYGRALQQPAIEAWRGDRANVREAQRLLANRARCNSAAASGTYHAAMEMDAVSSVA